MHFESMRQFLAILLGTFVSEDLTCISVGLLIRDRSVGPVLGILGCFAGIYLGDMGLWLLGRWLGQRVLHSQWLRKKVSPRQIRDLGKWLDRRGWAAVFATRFLPATRVPFYIVAGACGRRPWLFIVASFLAAAIWTPVLVLGVTLFGESIAVPVRNVLGTGWMSAIASGVILLLGLHCISHCFTEIGRARLWAKVSRLWRWEFWPSWLFYLPLLPYLAYLALRYRSLTVWTAANPGIPQGGVVGESKLEILSQLPARWVLPAGRLTSATAVSNLPDQWPMVLKPDASQRGAGVKLIRNRAEAEAYLQHATGPVIFQKFHPGPYEAGIFYYRFPGEKRGHIFSLTDKEFPVIAGDGKSTLEQLIWRHPRYRMQATTFLKRHAGQGGRILAENKPFQLALAGNHCQGTMFRDGAHLITRELEATVDAVARHFRGFYIGRFDVRYSDKEAFRAGRDLAIVELNGVTSESTNLYDPSWSIVAAYRVLFRQWELLFRIGNANRQRGIQVSGMWELAQAIRVYYAAPAGNPLAD